MFPLGGVLLPRMALPLHVFEPRYRTLMHDVRAGDDRFGVVLIDRGSEVGGDDVRGDVGTVARVLQAEELDDGRWVTVTVGEQRLRVLEWLPDDPYPRARVQLLDDLDSIAPDQDRLQASWARLRRLLALAVELGREVDPITTRLADDPVDAVWQLAVMTPAGPMDKRRLLAADDHTTRLDLVDEMLDETVELLSMELAAEGPNDLDASLRALLDDDEADDRHDDDGHDDDGDDR